ncbi:MAG: hypothetical protein DI537_17460 [Stutzerimonas stutzeri]|nr:MAG: hypothetical protein DI537_17460 [Stutzerimonas stutzeri]
MTSILKIHTLAAHNALQADIAALQRSAADGVMSLDAETLRTMRVLLEPVPDAFPIAISIPWEPMVYALRTCLARTGSYNGDAVLYDEPGSSASVPDLVLSGMTPRHVATLLEAVEQMTTADVPTGIVRSDLNPLRSPVAGAVVDQSVLPWISRSVREGFFLSRLAARENAADRFFAWLEARENDMTPAVSEFAKKYSFRIHHTGGGCLALMHEEDSEWHVLLTDDDGSLPTDPGSSENYFGIYHNESGWWLSTAAAFEDYLATRKTILAVAKARHNPGQDGFHLPLVQLLQLAGELRLINKGEEAAVRKILDR